MTMIRPLDGVQQSEYLKEIGGIYKRLEKRLETLLVNQDEWKRATSGRRTASWCLMTEAQRC